MIASICWKRLEQANLFVIQGDHKRSGIAIMLFFAQTLYYHMKQVQADQLLTLHHRASIWYAEHHQTSEAILHAFNAKEWPWAADLIEQKLLPLMSHVWGASRQLLNPLSEENSAHVYLLPRHVTSTGEASAQ